MTTQKQDAVFIGLFLLVMVAALVLEYKRIQAAQEHNRMINQFFTDAYEQANRRRWWQFWRKK